MPIILKYPCSIKHYITFSPKKVECGCPDCGRSPWNHGSYPRTVHHKSQSYVIKILRKFCPDCRKTFSLIPSFVRPWARFANHIRELFGRWVLASVPVSHLPERLTSIDTSVVSLRTLYRWKAQMAKSYQLWLLAQRKEAVDDPYRANELIHFYRKGATKGEEILFFLGLSFHAHLPKRGHVISTINLSLPPKAWW